MSNFRFFTDREQSMRKFINYDFFSELEKRFKASPIAMNNPLSGYSLVFRPRGAHLKLFQPKKQIRYLFKDYYKTNPLAGLVAQNSLGHFKSIKKGPEEYLLHYWG